MAELPGAVGVSRLCVYDTLAPDGQVGGTPHLHLCCSEAYVVTSGEGLVETLNLDGFARTPLRQGAVVWFTPGTIHRLVNHGGLQIVVLMQNSGLPEAGDAVLTFPQHLLDDPETYAAAATLPDGGAPGSDLGAAFRRRDLAVEGFTVLAEAAKAGDLGPLKTFHQAAARLVRPRLAEWRRRWEGGARAVAEETGRQLDALERGDLAHFEAAAVHELAGPSERERRGMCGLLEVYHVRKG
ncbi:cupin domain-containing protein [Nonomuraea dietziae]|uniref:Mannose-6-phosphate isomerase-like protein (Cupin superfamily) n=1 Tax=Nonomuraea dietziae TaxID=65515 RepID=A0A7W5Y5B5_9ACTN|nr:cupin domain-containing protein [Nonomuraea dietziae]MBB3725121.1 mannose-6-phosphate isomerase-like protein (cupin superfamily) [Nonomuraea dietziae]